MTVVATENHASLIPYVTAAEAYQLAAEELRRMLVLLEALNQEDWNKPTACTKWTVRDILAHQAGAYASGTGYGELLHQYTAVLKPGQVAEDAINERQLADRANRSPEQLLAELRRTGDKAARNWANGFRIFKLFGIPHPVPGWLAVRHLMLVIHSRDTWIHRLDICRATGRQFEQTREHDGRITALVVRDLVGSLARRLPKTMLVLDLDGVSGGRWTIGNTGPACEVRMEALEFHLYASGRMTYEQAAKRVVFSGDSETARRALQAFSVLY